MLITFLRKYCAPIVAILAYLALLTPYINVAPVWDAGFFYNRCILPQQSSLKCLGHIQVTCLPLYQLAHSLFPSANWTLNFVNALYGVIAIFSFHQLYRFVLPITGTLERTLWTTIFAVSPTFVATALHTTCDYSVVALFTCATWLLLSNHWKWTCLVGMLLVFSKEHGPILYGLALVAYFATIVLCHQTTRERIIKLFKSRWPLIVPLALFVIVYFYFGRPSAQQTFNENVLRIYTEQTTVKLYDRADWLLSFRYLLPLRSSKLSIILIYNFNWILGALVAIGIGLILFIRVKNQPNTSHQMRIRTGAWLALVTVLLLGTHAVTCIPSFLIPRYYLWLQPLLVLCAGVSLYSLFESLTIRIAFAFSTLTLVLLSNFRTLDPISKAILGTFKFGQHEMLNTTSRFAPWSYFSWNVGYGTDNLVYNLEFMKMHVLYERAMTDIQPTDQTILVASSGAAYLASTLGLNRDNFKRSVSPHNLIWPRHVITDWIVSQKSPPREIYFMAFPNFEAATDLQRLNNIYAIQYSQKYSDNGYDMSVYKMALRLPK